MKSNKLKNGILNNVSWLILDKILILFLQFFVGVKIANYYGKEIYGEYSYAMAIVGFSPIILEMVNSRIVKEFYEVNFSKTVSTVTTFKNLLSIIIFIITILTYPLFKEEKLFYLILILLTLDNVLLSMTTGIENYFEYKLLSKNIVISNNIVKISSYFLQYIGIVLKCSILIIPIIRIVGSCLRVLLLKKFYNDIFKEKIKFELDRKLIKKILNLSKYLWISFVSYIIATQTDKIMLGKILGMKDVGVYVIATQLISVLTILITPVQTSLYPKLLNLFKNNYKEYISFYKKYTTIITYVYLFGIGLSILVVKKLFHNIFSQEYSGAVEIYIYLTIGIFFRANSFLRSTHVTLTRNTQLILISEIVSMLFNVILNYILIRRLGVKGAAIATSITQIISLWGVDLFSKEGREILKYQISGFNIKNIFN